MFPAIKPSDLIARNEEREPVKRPKKSSWNVGELCAVEYSMCQIFMATVKELIFVTDTVTGSPQLTHYIIEYFDHTTEQVARNQVKPAFEVGDVIETAWSEKYKKIGLFHTASIIATHYDMIPPNIDIKFGDGKVINGVGLRFDEVYMFSINAP